MGKREVWRSLGTTNTDTARYRALQLKAAAHRLFKALTDKGRYMTQTQIDALVSKWLNDALDEAEDQRAMVGPVSEARREDAQTGLDALLDYSHEDLISGDYRRMVTEADALLESAGIPPLDHASPDFARLCRRLLRAQIEYAKIELDRWNGDYPDAALHHLRGGGTAPQPSLPTASLPISTVIDKYMSAIPRPVRTAEPLRQEFRRFIVVIGGDKPIAAVTKADCVRYKEHLQGSRGLS